MLLIANGIFFSFNVYADDDLIAYKIKAGYLYNFTKFVTWPTLDSATVFNFCILGGNELSEIFNPLESHQVLNNPIKVYYYNSFSQIPKNLTCHILYINDDSITIPSNFNLNNTLTVGNDTDFTSHGGMIGFTIDDNRIKLQINIDIVKSSSLKISAKLLELASVVTARNK